MKKIVTLCFLMALVCAKGWGQALSTYSFTATSGAYSSISGGTSVTLLKSNTRNNGADATDEGYANNIPIGFSFILTGTTYTYVNINSNGWFTLATALNSNTLTGTNSNANYYNTNDFTNLYFSPTIAPLWDDIAISTNGSDISYTTSGTSPSRIFTIQYNNVKWDYGATSPSIAFQVKLYETSNKIDFIYNRLSGSVDNGSLGASVGIASASGTYLSLNTSGTSVSSSTNTTTISSRPATGQVYTFAPPLTPPTLTAASGATVDAPFNVTFTDNAAWRGVITGITVNGTTLPPAAYTVSAGQITFNPAGSALLQSPGSKTIVVSATGYSGATVTQNIGVGAPFALTVTTQPTAPAASGGTLGAQPVITVRDKYNNLVPSVSVTASVPVAQSGSWTLGGSATVTTNASGVATFSGLTATNNTSPSAPYSANILFTSGSATITSNSFTIPGIPPTLTAASGATVDAPFNVTFTDNAAWRGVITGITVNGTTLSNTAYTVSAGQITFNPANSALFQTPGSKTIVVSATGYPTTSVTQNIGVGAPFALIVTTQPTAPAASGGTLGAQPVITVRDKYNNLVPSVSVTASVPAAQSGFWTLGGSATVTTNASGVATFSGLTATNNTSPSAPYSANILFTSGSAIVTSNSFIIPAIPPTLTADPSATVDAPFIVTFTDNATWRGVITGITVNGATLSPTAYTVSSGQITFNPANSALLQTPGSKTIVVSATGYSSASVTQNIGVGAPAKLAIITQPTAPAINGGTLSTQPVVRIQDQYGNTTTSTASVTAIVGSGAWIIGGPATVAASSGTATYSGLTAATGSANPVTATITFTSGTLTTATSTSFVIPGATITIGTISGSPFCAGLTVSVPFTSNGAFGANGGNPSNTYTAQLSSSTGSFTTPTNIGTLVSDGNSGPITATIPAGTAAGTGYRIRVVSNNPAVTSSANTTNLTINAPAVITGQPVHQETCAGTSKIFTVTTTGGTSPTYQWQYSADGTSGWGNVTGQTPPGITYTASTNSLTVTPSASTAGGLYYYRCIITVAGCSLLTSDTASLTVYATPSNAVAGNDQTICTTTTNTTLTATAPAIGTGTWSVVSAPNSSTSTTQFSNINNPAAIFTPAGGAGTYTLRWTVSNGTCTIKTDDVNIVVNAAPSITVAPGDQSVCAGLSQNFNVTATGTSPKYTWQYNTSTSPGGFNNVTTGLPANVAYSGTTTSTLTVTTNENVTAGNNNFYRVVVTVTGCESSTVISAPARLTINAKPVVTITPSSATICLGSGTNLTASSSVSGTTYNWSPATGLNSTTTATVTASPTSNTTYQVIGTTVPGCKDTTTAAVTVSAIPTGLSVTPTSTTICNGSNATLTASATATSAAMDDAGSENFNGTVSYTTTGNWAKQNDGYGYSLPTYTFHSNDNTSFEFAGIAAFGNASTTSYLTSPSINSTLYSSLTLSYYHAYRQGNVSPSSGKVEASTDGGANWTALKTYTSNTGSSDGGFVLETITLGSAYLNKPDLRIRFNFSSSISFATAFWAVDNVVLNGVRLPVFAWTASPAGSTAGLPTNAGTYLTSNKSITVAPTVSTTYTVIAKDTVTGCTSANSVNSTVTVNPTTTITGQPSPSTQQPKCQGSPLTFSVTATGTALAYQWHYSTTSATPDTTNDPIVPDAEGGKANTINTTVKSGQTFYYVIVYGTCGVKVSSVVTVNSTAVTISPVAPNELTQTKCQNTPANTIELTVNGTNVKYQWYSNNSNSSTGGTLIQGETSFDFTPPTNTPGITYYYLVASSNTCNFAKDTSQVFQVIVNQPSTAPTTVVSTAPGNAICAGQSTTLTVSGGTVGTGANIKWYVGGCGNGTALNATSSNTIVVSPAVGTTTYFARYEDPAPCNTLTACASITITVNPLPTATISGTTTVCQNDVQPSITFTGSNGTAPYTFTYTINGGSPQTVATTSGNSVTVSQSTTAAGLFTYNLTSVHDNSTTQCSNGVSGQSAVITVNPQPVIANKITTATCNGSFILTPTNGAGGDIIPTGTTYSWNVPSGTGFNGGASGTNQTSISGTLINTTNAPVTAVYTVTPKSGNNCTGSSFTVSVTVNPVPSIAAKTITAACNGSFSVMPTNGTDIVPANTTYTWNAPTGAGFTGGTGGSGTSVTGTLTNTTDANATATYTVTPTSGTCTGNSFTVTVTVKAVSNITNKTATICSGNTFTVTPVTGGTDIVPAGTTYTWSAPSYSSVSISGGAAGSGSSVSGTLVNSGTTSGTATYTVAPTSGSGCTGNSSFTVTVTVNPDAHITLTSAPSTTSQTLCINTPIMNITYTVSGGGTGAGATGLPSGVTGVYNGGVFTISGTPTQSGTFTYQVNTTGTCAQTSATGTITVQANATIALTSGNNTQSICINTPIANITYSVGGSSTGANASGLPNGVTGSYSGGVFTISGIPTQSGTFNYTVTTTGPCVTPSATGTITVGADATITLASAPSTTSQTLCINTPITNITYNIGGGGTGASASGLPTGVTGSYSSGVFTLSGTPTVSGTFTYTVNTTGACVTPSATGTITVRPNATITLTSGNNVQTLCSGSGAITTITYTIGGSGTGASASGLPNGVTGTYSGSVFTISGTPTVTGTFNYTVTTTGPCVTPSATGTITINQTPSATVAAASPTCEGTGVGITFTGTAGSTITYSISGSQTSTGSVLFPTGSGLTSTTISTPITPGTYTYTITGVSLGSCSGTAGSSATGTVNPNPTLVLTSASGTDNQTGCGNITITPIKYDFGGGASGVTVIITPSNAGITSNVNGNTVTISGTTTATTIYTYSVTTTGGSCGTITKNGTITISPYSWIGHTSNDWGTGSNWCSGSVPDPGADVVIPTVASGDYYPVLPVGTTVVGTLNINTGSTVTIDAGNTLQVNGAITGSGTITGSASSNLTTGGTGTVNFTQAVGSNVIKNLQINGGVLTLGNALNITAGSAPGVVTVSGSGQLATGDHLTLKSDANGTAAVGEYTGTGHTTDYITGNVTAERYTDAGIAAGKRAWRLVTSPVAGQTISQAWQEGQVYNAQAPPSNQPATYGTIITGEKLQPSAANSLGYDFVGGGNNTSIKRYDASGSAWVPLPGGAGTNNTSIRSEQAYLLFIRGDRTKNTPTLKGPANIRATGTLTQGPQTVSVPSANAFTLVGNPYAAPLNFAQLYAANTSVIQDQFYAWDAHLNDFGGYVTVSSTDGINYTAVPSAITQSGTVSVTQYIQSGQGFFVVPNNGGTLSISEGMKNTTVSTAIPASPFREPPSKVKQLRVNLNVRTNDSSAMLADGFLARFDDYYSDAATQQQNSSVKAGNLNENLSIHSQAGKDWIIEARPDVQKTDTIQLKLWNVSKRSYQLQMKADNFAAAPGVQAWLVDNYLQTKQELSLKGDIATINFAVTSDSLSWKSDRFLIVFRNSSAVLPVTLTQVKAILQNGGVNVNWTVSNEVNMKGYTVERSTDGGRTYTTVATQAAKNQTGSIVTSYDAFDALPKTGENLYRIRIEAKDGAVSYSSIVSITTGATGNIEIAVYPNPVRGGKVNLQLTNLAAGTYLVKLYSEGGQPVYQKKITIGQPNAVQSEELKLGNGLAQGSYQLHLTDSQGNTIKETRLIIGR